MERKLLSLPSFFVLLLIAGIAFLAAPVENVQATVPGVPTAEAVNPTGSVDADAADPINTGGKADVVVIKMTIPVKVTGVNDVEADPGFGKEDLTVTVTDTSDGAAFPSYQLPSAKVSVTPLAEDAAVPGEGTAEAPADNQWFVVNVDVPANGTGTITVVVKGGSVFQDEGSTDPYAQAADQPSTGNVVYYDTYNPLPTVTIFPVPASGTSARTSAGLDPFQVRFTMADPGGKNRGFESPPTFTSASIDITGGTVEDVGPVTPTETSSENPAGTSYEVLAYIKATGTSVVIGVKAGIVTDEDGGKNAAIPSSKTGTKLDNANAKEVMVDTALPQAVIDVPEGNQAVGVGFTATFTFTDQMGSGDDATHPTLQRDNLGNDGLELTTAKKEVTVTGGTIADFKPKPGSFKAYMATVTPNADAEKVVITVVENAVADAAGNGNAEYSKDVLTGYTAPPTTTDPSEETGTTGTALTGGKVGFTFDLPSSGVPTNGFVVLAKNPANAGFTSAVTPIDIKDTEEVAGTTVEVWQDLRHFLVGREGGTIDLIGPTAGPNAAKVRSLVISEVMWGNDNGLGTPSDSQWIELYNTTGAAISGTWTLRFSNKSKGVDMLANDAATTDTAPVVDKLSTWKTVGSVWEWRIEDKAGGSHGQSGKSTLNSATSPGSPVELVSMQRKIDYIGKVEKAGNDRAAQLKDFPDGSASGQWEATKEHGDMLTYRKGTPGNKPFIRTFDKTGVPRGSVVFNEIANRSAKEHDWIELYNKSGSAKKINDWELSVVQVKDGKNTDTELFIFKSDEDINVPANGYLLIVHRDPRHEDNPVEGGYEVNDPGDSERQSDGTSGKATRLYYVSDKLEIPEKDFLLILRNGNDKTGTHEKIEDIAGNNPRFDDASVNTQVWPLRSWTVGAKDDLGQNNDKTWVRNQGKAVFNGDEWKPDGGFTGVGIDRRYDSSDSYTSGTPGYANNAVQNEVKSDGLTNANPVVISEIMFGHGIDRSAPQWIELHNPSDTQAVNLKNWVLDINNYYDDETLVVRQDATLVLPEKFIQPNQTVLIVSVATTRRSDSNKFPTNRIISVWSTPELKKALEMQARRNAILSTTGFHLKLSDPKKRLVDEVGNIDGNRNTHDEPDWALPGGDHITEGYRSSMVRVENSENDGTERDSWRDAARVDSVADESGELYYGDDDDIGTPGYKPGGVLPVQLSSFYSKRNDTGAVVITWSTESELDNAGFNILRSQSRAGEFVRINAQLIPGAGTTGEKSAYTWTDTSAKPNVLYFYQIEDVSLAGDHRTLRTTRLRGYIGAAGKATTTWGDLKSRE